MREVKSAGCREFGGLFFYGVGRMSKKKNCRSPNKKKQKEKFTESEIKELMGHSSYCRGAGGRIRQRGGVVVIK